ncbi:MAG: peptidoglycan-binding domain-containing protein [Syntrophobacteraceae bacterium]|jgi:peptidoglycan hydrolase-like protein with peptidoglycan-binding domain
MALTSARLSGNKRLVAASNNQPEIGKGEKDQKAVEILQTCLVELGFDMPRSTKPNGLLDGVFGQETEAAVRQFQQSNALKPDGIVGRATLGRLDAIFDGLVKTEGVAIRIAMAAPNSNWRIT